MSPPQQQQRPARISAAAVSHQRGRVKRASAHDLIVRRDREMVGARRAVMVSCCPLLRAVVQTVEHGREFPRLTRVYASQSAKQQTKERRRIFGVCQQWTIATVSAVARDTRPKDWEVGLCTRSPLAVNKVHRLRYDVRQPPQLGRLVIRRTG